MQLESDAVITAENWEAPPPNLQVRGFAVSEEEATVSLTIEIDSFEIDVYLSPSEARDLARDLNDESEFAKDEVEHFGEPIDKGSRHG